MIGTLLNGRYRLEEKVGTGGMSTVYRAFDETLERWVAVKVMHASISEDEDQLERFRREAKTVARLSHPHVVTVIDAGEDDGHPYIVFEYVEGETLKDRIKHNGPLPVDEAIAYAIEIGRALTAAHEAQLVHRDVKPQNVLLDTDGRAKVTDFGIARSLEQHGLTAPGRVLGTTDYVAPEQALGHAVTAQSDVYSLGVVLYEMLAGDVPFKGESQVAVAMKHVRDPLPDVQARREDASATVASIVERATAKETKNRYASAADMVRDLEDALTMEAVRSGEVHGEATSVLRALPKDTGTFVPLRLRNPRRWVVLGLIAALLGAGVVVMLVTRGERGTKGNTPLPAGPGKPRPVLLRSDATKAFDPPPGDGKEHDESLTLAIDGSRPTSWTTEAYEGGFAGVGKEGVGIVVQARAPVAARELQFITSTPGWSGAVYAANEVPPDLAGWGSKLAGITDTKETDSVDLDTAGRKSRFYMLWISALPQGESKVAIQELSILN